MTISEKDQSAAIPIVQQNGDSITHRCWSCGDMRAAHFCHSCGKVQPPAPTDFFSFFGLPRRLNLDTSALEREMYGLSRRLHPDVCAQSTEMEQEWSLEQTSRLNDAYRTLCDPIARTEYLLRLEGLKIEEQSKTATDRARETGKAKQQAVPPDLLEEVFELNLQLEELRSNHKMGQKDPELEKQVEAARQNFEHKLDGMGAKLKKIWDEWDLLIEHNPGSEDRQRVCEKLLELLNQRRYVVHLLEEIEAVLGE